jgi:hypothetical protein
MCPVYFVNIVPGSYPPAIPLERGKQHPNPLVVPHTLRDLRRVRGHPQFPRQRVIPLDFPIPVSDYLRKM